MIQIDVLSFVRKLLSLYSVPTYIISPPFENLDNIDLGLRKNILKNFNIESLTKNLVYNCKDNTVYYLTDNYYCSYCFMKLPQKDFGDKTYLIIGPYRFEEIDSTRFMQISESLKFPLQIAKQMEEYYNCVIFIPYETEFKAVIIALASEIFGEDDKFEIGLSENSLWNDKGYLDYTDSDKPFLYANLIEERYAIENKLLHYVSCGNTVNALNIVSMLKIPQRFDDPIRDIKNKLIILNSLLRKAVEAGYVHPIHIDKVSGEFAKKIEAITSIKNSENIRYEMIRKYCMLVKNYSLKGYSIIVQKAINYIELNLSYDLSLKTISNVLDINASYLSTLFKKETNFTLTEYVHKKRVERSLFFLNTTNMQIQNIASYVGILDVNYFTKIFKRYVGKTPKEYRDMISSS